jgi:uncharacterized protein involved in tellurium resistance
MDGDVKIRERENFLQRRAAPPRRNGEVMVCCYERDIGCLAPVESGRLRVVQLLGGIFGDYWAVQRVWWFIFGYCVISDGK